MFLALIIFIIEKGDGVKGINDEECEIRFLFLIMAVLVIGITIFVNVLAATVDLSWDMTTNKLYSIGEQTESILESLQKK